MSGGFNLDDYVPVAERIEAFYERFPEGSLQSEIVTLPEALSIEEPQTRVTVKAYAYRTPDDPRPGTGHASVTIPGSTPYTRGSEVENAETSAWGRAIASLGFDVRRGIVSQEEMRNQQPRGGEREARTLGRRTEPRHPATTRPAVPNKGQALGQLAEVMRDHGLTFAHVDEMARGVGIDRGKSSAADILRLVAAIEKPSALGTSGGEGDGASSATPSPTDTPESAANATPATDPATVSPPVAGSGPSLEDVLEATGGEVIVPRPGTDAYRALPPAERASAKAYWSARLLQPIQETMSEALGAPEHD